MDLKVSPEVAALIDRCLAGDLDKHPDRAVREVVGAVTAAARATQRDVRAALEARRHSAAGAIRTTALAEVLVGMLKDRDDASDE